MRRSICALFGLCLGFVAGAGPSSAAVTATTLHSFDGDDGWSPMGALVDGGDGYLYGTTTLGGDLVLGSPSGTVYRITPGGSLSTLYTFDFQITGDRPFAGVLRMADGTLFGTNRGSGAYEGNVFRLDSGGFTSLHDFTGNFVGGDGGHPEAAPVEGGDGNLYGTTTTGGPMDIGTLYRIDALGDYTLVHSFSGGVGPQDGATPRALVLGDDGDLYGTTSALGPTQPTASSGTVYRFSPGESGVTTVHAFRGSDGTGPSSLVKGPDGDFYGTTTAGGTKNQGTVFRLAPDGDFEVLHAFDPAAGDGTGPVGLTVGSDGNLYGATSSGGAGIGTVFRVRPNGAFRTLFVFDLFAVGSGGGGSSPQGPPVQVGNKLYGTTFLGGTGGKGIVYRFDGFSVPEPGAAAGGAAAGLGLVVARRRRGSRR